MHRLWHIPELVIEIISFLPARDIDRAFHISRHFQTTLKANLPPQLRPLPDTRPQAKHPASKTSSGQKTPLQEVIAKASEYVAHEAATPKQLKMEDEYYYWRQGVRGQISDALLPHLPPVFAKSSTRLVDGYEALAEGKVALSLQTDVPYHALYELVHGEEKESWGEVLAEGVRTVTVFCLGGVSWDLLYWGVKYRDNGGVQRFGVRVERDEGVRLGDVMEELAGTLIIDSMSGGLGQDVRLVWVFDDGCKEVVTKAKHEMNRFC